MLNVSGAANPRRKEKKMKKYRVFMERRETAPHHIFPIIKAENITEAIVQANNKYKEKGFSVVSVYEEVFSR